MEIGIMLLDLETRYEQLKAERQQRQLAHIKEDAGYSAVLGELERMIMHLMQQQNNTSPDAPGDTESGAGGDVQKATHDAPAQLLTSPVEPGSEFLETSEQPFRKIEGRRSPGGSGRRGSGRYA